MTETLTVLNNYFHDFFVAMVFVGGIAVRRSVAASSRAASAELASTYAMLADKLYALSIWSFGYVVVGGFFRVLTSRSFEIADAVRNGQLLALKVKYVMLAVLLVSGLLMLFFARRGTKPS